MLVYLHIPFCHRICPYCSFYKHTPSGTPTPIPRFIDALLTEARHTLSEQTATPRTLYFGGGTPSMLSPSHLGSLFAGLREMVDFGALDEVTFEANPATFDLAKAKLFRELGIRRVSLGIQSFHPPTLQTLGREHTARQAADSVRILRDAGMPSINIDLMFSVPGLDLGAWRETLGQAIDLNPDHVSAYNLTYEEDTAFFEKLARGELDACEDRDADQFTLAHELLDAAGFEHYETSNYARPGHRSSHNHGYWSGEDYLGLGPSAVSTLGNTRSRNVSDTARYVEMVESIGNARTESESLTEEQLRIERIALLLRTKEGVPLRLLEDADLSRLTDHRLASVRNDRLILTRKGAPLVDVIAGELI